MVPIISIYKNSGFSGFVQTKFSGRVQSFRRFLVFWSKNRLAFKKGDGGHSLFFFFVLVVVGGC